MVNERNAEQTRSKILQAAFDEMYEHGYQGMRLDTVLDATGLTKGALYHHFPNKLALAYAVLDEVVSEYIHERWRNPLGEGDVLERLQQRFTESIDEHPEVATKGCPLNNLVQEMSGIDQGFNVRLQATYGMWCTTVAEALAKGQAEGIVKANINSITAAMFMLSAYQGIAGTAKCMQSMDVLRQLVAELCEYIESLRA